MRSSDCGAPARGARAPAGWTRLRRRRPGRVGDDAGAARRGSIRRTPRSTSDASASCDASPAAMTVSRDGAYTRRWNAAHLREGHAAERVLRPDRLVPVRMAAVQQPGEGAIRDRRRHVAQLDEPVQAQLADAIEIALLQSSGGRSCRRAARRPRRRPRERRQRQRASRPTRFRCPGARPCARALRARRSRPDRRTLRRACRS